MFLYNVLLGMCVDLFTPLSTYNTLLFVDDDRCTRYTSQWKQYRGNSFHDFLVIQKI